MFNYRRRGGVKYDKRKAIKSITINGSIIENSTNTDSAVFVVNCDADIPKTVTLQVEGSAFTETMNSAGTASFSVSGLSSSGTLEVTATCPDDWRYQSGSTSTSTTFQNPGLKASAKDITVGKTETITVTVPSDATGECYALINDVRYSGGSIINGKSKIFIENLPADDYTAECVYSGDAKYCSKIVVTSFRVKGGTQIVE